MLTYHQFWLQYTSWQWSQWSSKCYAQTVWTFQKSEVYWLNTNFNRFFINRYWKILGLWLTKLRKGLTLKTNHTRFVKTNNRNCKNTLVFKNKINGQSNQRKQPWKVWVSSQKQSRLWRQPTIVSRYCLHCSTTQIY